jgi:hypothetical protein
MKYRRTGTRVSQQPKASEDVQRSVINHFMAQQAAAAETQRMLLKTLIDRNRDTAFGKDHGFAAIRSVADFQRQVPIQHWAEIDPYVDRQVAGEQGVLTHEPPLLYHWTSGTSGARKLIPFTRTCGEATEETLRIWLYTALRDNPRMLNGKVSMLVNPGIDAFTETRAPYGSVSGNLYFRMPKFLRQHYANTYDVYHIEDLQARFYTLLRFALEQNCSLTLTGNPAGQRQMFEMADRLSELLIQDIHDGTLSDRFEVPNHIRTSAINDLKPNPARARVLAQAKQANGTLRPVDYWPELEVVGVWLGGSMGHFAPSLREWCGEKFQFRDIGYMASEGIFSVPLANGTPDSALTLHSTFFEFVPETDFGHDGAPVLLAHELESGKNYQIVVTTSGGLYRYAINDVIRVSEMANGAPRIRFLYKGDNIQNIHGEMVTIDNVTTAIAASAKSLGIALRHFQAVADQSKSRYILYVEPMRATPAAALRTMLMRFEAEMRRQNLNYDYFRNNEYLKTPRLRLMREGWFAQINADQNSQGYRGAQFKPSVLAGAPQHPEMAEAEISFEAVPEA